MSNINCLVMTVKIGDRMQSQEQIDAITPQLLGEIRVLNIGSANQEFIKEKDGPEKGLDPVVIGALLVSVIPATLTKLLDFFPDWAMQKQERTIKTSDVKSKSD